MKKPLSVVVKAGHDFGVKVMGDNLGCPDMVEAAKWLEDLGCDYIVHHIGYDERRGIAAQGKRMPSPLDQLREVVHAVNIPVQAVGGLSLGTGNSLSRIWCTVSCAGRAVDH